jgi:hypothetical protein
VAKQPMWAASVVRKGPIVYAESWHSSMWSANYALSIPDWTINICFSKGKGFSALDRDFEYYAQGSCEVRAGKGELQMQTVETPHDRKIGRAAKDLYCN